MSCKLVKVVDELSDIVNQLILAVGKLIWAVSKLIQAVDKPSWFTNTPKLSENSPYLLRFLLEFTATHLYSWVERASARVKFFSQEHNKKMNVTLSTQSLAR